MWNKPQLLTAISDLLYVAAAAALLVAAVLWGVRLPLFPLREVALTNELRELQPGELKRSLSAHLRGNFFSVDVEGLRQSLEELPWARSVEVRRQWPSRIEVSIEEHVPVAYWGQATGQLVNSHGEVFSAPLSAAPNLPIPHLPVLQGPNGLAPEMLTSFRQAEGILKPIGRMPVALNVSPRLAVQLRLDDGMVVELGRQQAKAPVRERLERFVEYYPEVINAVRQRLGVASPGAGGASAQVAVVDMRYPNGFALRLAAAHASENKGTP